MLVDGDLMPQGLRDLPGMDAGFGRSILCTLLFQGVREKPQAHRDKEALEAKTIGVAENLLPVPQPSSLFCRRKGNGQAW